MQQRLMAWFQEHGRVLPWRQTRNPYHILVSEIMLQQTQVLRVVPRYTAFLGTYPTLEALAAAPTADIIRAWSGLGYNRRAVNLQRIARIVLEKYGGTFPQTVEELRRLPGIGHYTAGAIACFAFEQDVAFLDTNMRRVIHRWLVGADDGEENPTERTLIAHAEEVLPRGQGWLWNQSIMELGALLCTATTPTCWRCPIKAECRAYAMWCERDEQALVAMVASSPSAPPPTQARQATKRPSEPFIGSNRYYRGRFIDRLRVIPSSDELRLVDVGPSLKPDFDVSCDMVWLEQLATELARDGLIEFVDGRVRLQQ